MADGTVVIDVKLNSDQAQSSVAGLKGSLSGMGTLGVAAGNLIATGITKAASALAGFAQDSITTGATFEQSMSNVAALSGATGSELDALSAKAKEMGSTTTFSASECADALSYMALAGWDSQQSIDGLDGVLALAQAGSMDLAAASDMVTDYLSAFGMEASQSAQFADVLAYAQANANTSAEGLGMAFKNCAANANAAGMDVETVTAAISMMANQGLKGSEAGTALNAVMRDMTSKMKDGAIAIGDTKVAVQDAQGNYRDFADILSDVQAATNGMGDAEKASALQSTFTADSIKGLNLMLNAGTDEMTAFRDELYNSSGAAQDMASIMTDNLNGSLAAMNSAVEGVQIQVFEALSPILRDIADAMTNGVLPAVSSFIGVITGVAPAMEDTEAAASPMQKAFITVGKAVNELADAFAPLAKAAMPVIKEVASALGSILVTAFTNIIGIVKSVVQTFTPAFETILSIVQKVMPPVKTAVETVFNAIGAVVEKVMPIVGNIVNSQVAFIGGIFKTVVPPILTIVTTVFSGISGAVTTALDLVNGAINGAKAVFTGIANTFSSVGKNIVDGIINGVTGAAGQLMSSLKNLATNALNAAKNALGIKSPSREFRDKIGKQIVAGMVKGIEDDKNNAKKSAKELGELTIKAAESKLKDLKAVKDRSAKYERDYWFAVSDYLDKGGTAYRKALKKATDAAEKIDSDYLSKRKSNLSDRQDLEDMSYRQLVTYWQKTLKKLTEGTEAYKEAEHELAKAQKSMAEDIASQMETITTNAQKSAEDIMQAYQDAVESRADKIMSVFDLFDEYSIEELGEVDLIGNLASQVYALDEYGASLAELEGRLAGTDLFAEVKNQGLDALPYIKQLNKMTDEQIAEYLSLYDKRAERVKTQAEKDTKSMLEDANEKLDQLNKDTADSLAELEKQFKDTKLELPNVKLPHFSVSGSFDLESGSVPTVSVDWYKTGGIFDKASVIGIGEAGPEAVVPLSGQQMQPFAKAITENMNIDAAVETLLRALPSIIANNTPNSMSVNKREFARLVREV